MAEFTPCSRGEFVRRARQKFPFLSEENIAKLILRNHVKPIRKDGCYLRFDLQSWNDLEHFVATRSRQAKQFVQGEIQ